MARILEKQNRLQMSQVFSFRASMIKWALLFKDSMSGTEERVKLLDSHTNCKCTHRSKRVCRVNFCVFTATVYASVEIIIHLDGLGD